MPMPAAKAGEDVGVITAVFQHGGVHHTAAQNFQPAAALTAAHKAFHVHLGARLGEGEMRRAQARAGVFAESARGKIIQGAFHVRESDASADHQHLHLHKFNFRARRELLVAHGRAR
jgi:hypothetical protein